jgi:hypothetical protein
VPIAKGSARQFRLEPHLIEREIKESNGAGHLRQLVLKAAMGLVVLLCGISSPKADQLDDGAAAYRRGDYKSALELLRPLADQGVPRAQNGIGVMYATGRGIDHDDAEAAAWFKKAADQGYANAQARLGYFYRKGLGVPKDLDRALALTQSAADQGDVTGEFYLGTMYRLGEGVGRDDAKAAGYFRKAAEQGNAAAQYNLGGMYARGQGMPRDHVQAAGWYRKAAEQGNVGAQIALGAAFNAGIGVSKDYVQAYKWMSLGTERYQPWYASYRWKIKLLCFALSWQMTADQLVEAERQRKEWKPNNQAPRPK